mmetsp:Transcript_75026/g.119225  ORF Transcript_75026/g.119225 Transcript_75026/m.119225 type:complete len:222 (-) Transcript_75026:1390-2055(-)
MAWNCVVMDMGTKSGASALNDENAAAAAASTSSGDLAGLPATMSAKFRTKALDSSDLPLSGSTSGSFCSSCSRCSTGSASISSFVRSEDAGATGFSSLEFVNRRDSEVPELLLGKASAFSTFSAFSAFSALVAGLVAPLPTFGCRCRSRCRCRFDKEASAASGASGTSGASSGSSCGSGSSAGSCSLGICPSFAPRKTCSSPFRLPPRDLDETLLVHPSSP